MWEKAGGASGSMVACDRGALGGTLSAAACGSVDADSRDAGCGASGDAAAVAAGPCAVTSAGGEAGVVGASGERAASRTCGEIAASIMVDSIAPFTVRADATFSPESLAPGVEAPRTAQRAVFSSIARKAALIASGAGGGPAG